MKLIEALPPFIGEFDNINTRRAYESILNPFVKAIGPSRPIANVTNLDLHSYIQDLKNLETGWANHPTRPPSQKPLSPSTITNHVRVIKRFFSWLESLGEIERNPSETLKMPRRARRVSRNKAATPEEIELILRAAFGKPRDYAICMFIVDTGCRAGGAAGLKIEDLDLDKLKAVVTEKGPKTRMVWFSQETAHALKVWLAKRPHYKHSFVFGSRKGKPVPHTISQTVRRNAVKAGVRSLGPHSLRHAKGYALADSKVDASTAALALGHEDPATTLRHYYPVDLQRAEDAIRATHQPEKNDGKIRKLREG